MRMEFTPKTRRVHFLSPPLIPMKTFLRNGFLALLVLTATASLRAQFVISEFMANNLNSAEVDDDGKHSDWLEIQNGGAGSASLNGWYLTDNPGDLRKWQFPATTPAVTLAGGTRITVWASGKNRKLNATKLHTNFKLSSSASFLALVRPDGVTIEHSYNYPGQFPNGTYGIAATVTPNIVLADTPTPAAGKAKVATSESDFTTNFANWNSSTTFDDSTWQAGAGFGFGSPFTGILGANGNISAMMLNVNASCFVRYTFTPPTGSISAVRLKTKYDDGYIAYLNGTSIASDRAPASPVWNSAATSDKTDGTAGTAATVTPAAGPGLLVPGTNVLAFQLLNSSASNANALLRPQLEIDTYVISGTGYLSSSTRGLINSPIKTTVGPSISETTDKPTQPIGGATSAPLLITTKVSQTLNPLAATAPVVLKYRIQFGTETAITMLDDGTGGDIVANDKIFTASVPTTAMTAGQMIRWRIEAKDNAATPNYSYDPPYPGFSITAPPTANPPAIDQAIEYEQYFGTIAVPTLVGATNLPVLHWFLTGTDNTGSSSVPNSTYPGTRCSFFWQPLPEDNPGPNYSPPKPRFYDNVLVNLHGQSSSGFPKKSHDLSFSKDNKFLWKDGTPETSGINLLTNYADKTKVRNPIAWWTWEKTYHIASHYDTLVRVQQNGVFKGLYDVVENANASWLKRENLDDAGALYKVYNQLEAATITTGNNSVEKKNPDDGDSSDLGIFVAGIADTNSMTNRLKYAYDNADIASLINLLATHSILLSRDFGHKNYYIYRDTHGTGEWSLLPWDQDLGMGHTWNGTQGYFDDDIHSQGPLQIGVNTNRLINIVYNTPELNNMYVRRLRTLADQFFVSASATDGPWEQRIASILNQIDQNPNNPAAGTDDADLDMRAWGYFVDGSGTAVSYTNASVLDHTVRAQANRITTANPNPPQPAAIYPAWGDNSTNLLAFIPGRRAFFFNTTPPVSTGLSVPAATASLPSSQPLDPPLIIEGIDYNPAAGTQDQEYFIIRNPNNYAVDISGWTLSGSVEMTFKGGTIIPAAGSATSQATNSAYVNQLIVANKPQGFRTRSTSPKVNEYRQVSGPYNHQLSARGGTIILNRPNDPLNPAAGFTPVVTQAYNGVPTEQQNALRITELNYDPAPATVGELATLPGLLAGDFEFIELTNTGSTSMNLAGAKFDNGIDFTFPSPYTLAAGARCLVVASQSAFEARYGTGFPIAGEFEGSLNNGGETIRLVDSVGEEILEFTYDNNWYPVPPGTYRSLVTTSTNPAYTDYSLPSTWALSAPGNGTPNSTDTAYSQVYEGWRLSRFTAAELPTLVDPNLPAALEQDPDGDGLTNFNEYAFATDPKSQNAAAAPTSSVVTVGADSFLTITFKRPKNALDVTYTIEASEDLEASNWQTVSDPTATTTDLGNGYEQVTYRDTTTREAAPRRFLRATAVK